MKPEHFDRLQALVASRTGMRLSRTRMHLADHRLGPVARREGFASVDDLLASLWSRPVASLGWAVIEAMLNLETWFLRERAAFEVLERDLLPALRRARNGARLRLLSAGCATGQEVFSLAIVCEEAGVDVEIVGVDLSHAALERARSGVYTAFEIQRGLSAARMLAHFDKSGDTWRARPELRSRISFVRENLLDPPETRQGFDIVFCRHVLSEVEPSRRAAVIEGLEARLVDDGCLFLAAEERIEGDTVAFRPVAGRKGLYVKAPAAIRRAA
jgi:chemotaxis protein methyltransferase CheR